LSAFAALVDRFESPLISYLMRRTGRLEDARDLAQETFLRAWERRGTFRPAEPVAPWLFTIASRLATDAWRKRSRDAAAATNHTAHAHHDDDDASHHHLRLGPQPSASHGSSDDHDAGRHPQGRAEIWAIADRVLAPDVAEALWLRYVAGLEAEHIARVQGRTAVGVRVMLMRARRRLETELTRVPTLAATPAPANVSRVPAGPALAPVEQ
jgi:RNA polymerase sigma-70 factor, ECF subfamily